MCFYDALIADEIVQLIPPTTKLVYVGKRGDSPSFQQKNINELISYYARMGKKVIRLKGGDCGILGRLSEEIDELNRFSIPYTITPGITAMQSLPSEIGLLTTQREVSDGVTITTARLSGGEISKLSDRSNNTLVIYMGILKISQIVNQLIKDGYSKQLPVAVAINLTRKKKQFLYGTLENIVSKTEKAKVRPPGLIICGIVCHKNLLISPPPFILLKKRVFIYSNKKEMRLQNSLLFWGAYNSTIANSLPESLANYDAIIILKEITTHSFKKIKKLNLPISYESQINKINRDFFTQLIS